MSKIKRLYIAGCLTPTCRTSKNPAIDYLYNLREMIRWSNKTYFAGFDPFCPALDHQFFMQLQNGEHITEKMIKRYSKSWLEVCDAMLLTPGWKSSAGTSAEIKFCEEHNIPIFETLEELVNFNNKQEGE